MLMPSIFGESLFDDLMDEFSSMDDEMEKMEKKLYGHHAKNMMKTDIRETDDSYELEMDLPGFKREDVQVSLSDGYLTICAAKGLDKDKKEKTSGKYIRRERFAGTCERTFYVGENLTQEEIKGQFKHGILKLTIPKKKAKPTVEEKRYITIDG